MTAEATVALPRSQPKAMFSPEPSAVGGSQLTAFTRFCEETVGQSFQDHAALQEFSVGEYRRLWRLFLEWSGLLWEGSPEPVCTDDRCEHATFFPDVRLNYAENLLRIDSPEDGERTALVAHHALREPERTTRRELRDQVRTLAAHLRAMGVTAGDRVAAVAGNNAEVVVGGLAAAAVGATFSSAAPNMGPRALLSRFEQLSPAVLMANLEGGVAGASTALAGRVGEVARALPSLKAVIALDEGRVPPQLTAPLYRLSDLLTGADEDAADEEWVRFGFNHPLFVLFSSGTTGRPKCIVHGAGGTLLEHVKEHRLHVDLRPGDRLFFHTSAAWMMWNWQLSALASGVEIVLFDGPLTGPDTLWRLVSAEGVSHFGTSPPYLQLCEDGGYSPRHAASLPALRTVLSTGSILHDSQFDWVRDHVGPVPVQSISGGTDIVGCFVLGNPNLPVFRGQIQCRSLGLDVQARQTLETPSSSGVGELVCQNPFPSRPLGLLGDDGAGFHEAYFRRNPGVWTHGDLIEFAPDGQSRIHGRSDGVLNIRGIRLGSADIYEALCDVPEVQEAMAVEQRTPGMPGRSRVVLLVVLRPGLSLNGRLIVRIRREIARHASPLHIPELVVQVDEVPITHSGKRSERAARDSVNGLPVANADALANPESLAAIRRAVALAEVERRELAGAAEPPPDASTETRLRAIWEGVLGVAPLQPDDNFFDVGGTSLAALRLFHLIHERLGVELPLSTLIHAQTTAAMAALIDGPTEDRVPSLVLLRPGTGDPLFLVHSLGGDVLEMRQLALGLKEGPPVYGLQALGLDPGQQPQTRIEDMADTYIETIRTVQPNGPYALAGFSFGGLVAFEMARRLTGHGEEVRWLGLIDAEVHWDCLPRMLRWRYHATRPARRLRWALGASRAELANYLRGRVLRPLPWAPLAAPTPEWHALPPVQRRIWEIGLRAFKAYRPGPYAGSATLFLAEVRRVGMCDPLPAWTRVVKGGLTVERSPGGHLDAVGEGGGVADRISAQLATLGAAAPTPDSRYPT